MLVYKMEPHSYKELPMRIGELGTVHRHEKSGQLHGLMRVRSFTQDDAHIFMTEEQVTGEIQIREARLDKVPYMIDIGEKEQSNKTVSVRQRDGEPGQQDMGEMMLSDFISVVKRH